MSSTKNNQAPKSLLKRKKLWIAASAGLFLIALSVICFFLFKPKSSQCIVYPDFPEPAGLKAESNGKRYSLLLVTIDTLRYDYLSSNGCALPTTPYIDKLMGQGLSFSHALTPIPRTSPALASLLTGRYPHKTGLRFNTGELSPNVVTLAEIMKNAGYQTAAVISSNVLRPERRLDRGFLVYDFARGWRDALTTSQAAIKYLEGFRKDSPFFLWVHYIDPHMPYYPPENLAVEFDPDYQGKYRLHFGNKPGHGGESYPDEVGKINAVYRNNLGKKVNDHIRKIYAADVRLSDTGVMQLIESARKIVKDDLVIVFTVDHGESLGEHDYYYEHGDYLYNTTLRVPLAFVLPENHPKNTAGKVDDWVSLIDVVPTTLDLLDIEVSSDHLLDIDGSSLIPYWEGKSPAARPIFAESGKCNYEEFVKRRVKFDVSGRFRCVVYDEWKLIWTPFQKKNLLYELYNVEQDPYETKNLYRPDHPEAARLKKFLKAWMTGQPINVMEPTPSKEDIEALKALGYIE
jgi:arylsulfatase